LEYQKFLFCQLKHEPFRKTFDISLYSFIQVAGRNAVKLGQIAVEHHALAADFVDFALDRSEFFHRFGSK